MAKPRDRRKHVITVCRSTPVSYIPWWRLCPLLSTSAVTPVITCYVKPSMPLLPTPLPYRLPLLRRLPRPGRRLHVNGSAGLLVRGRHRRRQADRCPRAARPPNALRLGRSRDIARCRPVPPARHVRWSTMSAGITTSLLLRIARVSAGSSPGETFSSGYGLLGQGVCHSLKEKIVAGN